MRRHILHITAALLAFTAAFLTASKLENLAYALPPALAVFFFAKVIPRLEIDLHFLSVAALSCFLWAAGAYALFSMLPAGGSCVVEFSDAAPTSEPGRNAQLTDGAEPNSNDLPGITAYSCDGANTNPTALNSIWAGAIDKKAISKPAPLYPPLAKAACVKGTVAVSVVINESGEVVWAQALSGHPPLRQAAMGAACRARFAPTLVDGPPIRVSGILTYNFGL